MHILSIYDLAGAPFEAVFTLADQLREAPANAATPLLGGRTFALFFPETSLRTRLTFEQGITSLGGKCVLFPPASLDTRESPADLTAYAANWTDALIIRHPDHARVEAIAETSPIPVINAMTALGHPCEILADLYALRSLRPDYRALRYTFVGPASNIARSWQEAAAVLKLDLRHVCADGERLAADGPNYQFHTELADGLAGAEVVLTDSLPGYLRYDGYISRYQITAERLKLAQPGVLLNPCPPFYRGEEVSACAIASEAFVGHAFKRSLLPVQQALLLTALGVHPPLAAAAASPR